VYAVGWGWRRVEGVDRCPYHVVEQGRLTHRLAALRNRFPTRSKERAQPQRDAISPRIDGRPLSA
jgi:hypothetical protein